MPHGSPDSASGAQPPPEGPVTTAKHKDTRARVEEFRRKHRTSLLTLLFTDLVGSTKLKQSRGDLDAVALMQAHAAMVRETLSACAEAQEVSTAGDAFFCVFVRPSDAVRFALRVQARTRADFTGESSLAIRIGIHLGEVVVEERPGEAKPLDLFGLQVDTAARVQSLAEAGQVLLTRSVFDNARQVLKGRDLDGLGELTWLNHGPYRMKGVEEPVEVCEVGETGVGVLRAPAATEKARPAEMSEEELGWRPSIGARLPGAEWTMEEKLGEGGFGEIWLASHKAARERRVFKFCFLKEKARALRRELALFRLIREKIGENASIVRLHEVHLEEAPYYLGMEHVPGPNLRDWLLGGKPPLSTRAKLDVAAQVADALDAAHRAGVIHQDIKPQNILVDASAPPLPSGAPRVKLSDFGVGRVVDERVLSQITLTGGVTFLRTTMSTSESGTLLYMAPERVEGKAATPKSDLYSLGVVLFQLVGGNLDRAVTPDWESEVGDATLREDLRGLLAGTPERRIATAAEVARRLRSWGLRRRMHTLMRAAGLAALMAVAVGASWAWFAHQASTLERQAEKEMRLRLEAENERVRAEQAEVVARTEKRRFHAEAEQLRAELDEKAGNTMSALAHDIASLRVNPTTPVADAAWRLLVPSGRLLWTSPNLAQHAEEVLSVAFSPDGTRIVSGSGDKTIRIWDAATGKELLRLVGHASHVTSVAFSPDGRRIVSGSTDTTVRLWDTATGEPLSRLEGHTDSVSSVAFSADGTRIASGSEDKTIRIWDAATGKELSRLVGSAGGVSSVAFSPDGGRIVSGSGGVRLAAGSYENTIRVWDAATGKQVSSIEGHAGPVGSVAFSPDGKRIVSGSMDKTVRLWDATTCKEVSRLEGHANGVKSVAFSRDGTRIVSASRDGTLRLWDAGTGRPLARMESHTGWVMAAAFSPDGSRIASGGMDNTLRVWEGTTGKELSGPIEGHTQAVSCVAFSPDGSRIASGSDDQTICLWDAATGKELSRFKEHSFRVTSIAFSPEGSRILSTSPSDPMRIWDAGTGGEVSSLQGDHAHATFAAFSPDGRLIVSGGRESRLYLWSTATGQEVFPLEGHSDMATCVAFSPDGTRVASGSDDKTVRLWDAKTGKAVSRLEGHTGSVTSVAFSPDGTRAVSASYDRTLRVWDVRTGGEVSRMESGSSFITSVAFSPDGTRIAAGGWDGHLRLWDAATGKEIARLEGHADAVQSVAFSPDGTRIVSGSRDKTVRLWEVPAQYGPCGGGEAGKGVTGIEGHTQPVSSVAFDAKGARVVSGSVDGTIRLWDAATGKEVLRFEEPTGMVSSVAFSPGGARIASRSYENTIRLWDTATGKEVFHVEGERVGCDAVLAFSPDGRRIASCSVDGSVSLVNVETGREVARLKGHAGPVGSVCFSLDGGRIVSAGWDKTIRLWDAATGSEVSRLTGHTGAVLTVAISPDGSRIASGAYDATIRLWDAATGKELHRLEGRTGEVHSVAFSPDGTRLISGSQDRTIRIWDAATGKELSRIEGHTGCVTSVAFSPDGTRILSGSNDNTIRLWDAATGKEVSRIGGHASPVDTVAFSQDGKTIVTRDQSKAILVWAAGTGTQVRDYPQADAQRILDAVSRLHGPSAPTRVPRLGVIVLGGEAEWRSAWYDPERDENGLSRKVARILDRWERDLGMHVNLDTGEVERIPTPGGAYTSVPRIAPTCK